MRVTHPLQPNSPKFHRSRLLPGSYGECLDNVHLNDFAFGILAGVELFYVRPVG